MPIDKDSIEQELAKSSSQISIIELVNYVIEYAFDSRASDIHIDPSEKSIVVRFRIDGIMTPIFDIPKSIQHEIISRIKVLAGMRIDEHQAAQDGRFKFGTKDGKNKFDIRVSIAPTYYGENCVMRLLVEHGEKFDLASIGFSEKDIEKVHRAIKKPYGMILATGPTGSGKTTTLYTILKELNSPQVTIITIEDPIEYSLEGIEQIQVNNQTGLTFANGLRSILRQDPNIIMVGEIRDDETASIAVNAALTGHLLLSTLHTNDAATTLPRLLDMNVEPFLIASTVNIAISQRLIRKLCNACKVKKEFKEGEVQALAGVIPPDFFRESGICHPVGCKECDNTGYKSRIGIHEVLEVTDAIKDAIMRNLPASEIKKIAIKEGMTTILEDGLDKVKQCITSIEEVLRVTHE